MSFKAKQSIRCIGAIVAYLIGSGFASGQEVMQYFASYGPVYGGLGGLITLGLMIWCARCVMRDAFDLQLDDVNQIFHYYCGNFLGSILKWVIPIFLYCIYVIMLSGAGALLEEYYGIPSVWGRTIMLVLSLGVVLLGITKLTDIIGFIGPLIIVLTLVISISCIIINPSGILSSRRFLTGVTVTQATRFWWLSGINYGTFCGLTLIPYAASLGKDMPDKKTAGIGGSLGSLAFAGTAMVLSYGMLSQIDLVYDKSVPTVFLADNLIQGAGAVFSLVMFAGIFTTAVPMLWTTVNRFETNEKSLKYKLFAIALGAIAFFGGKLPFSNLVNLIYPYMGYVGMVVFLCVLIKEIRKKHNAVNPCA